MKLLQIVESPIDINNLYKKVVCKTVGAICTFSGVVRQNKQGKKVCYLLYEAYQSAALKQFTKIADAAIKQFDVQQVVIVHRIGKVLVGECSLFVVIATAHRAGSFLACQFCIEKIKKQAQVWKKEVYEDDTQKWI